MLSNTFAAVAGLASLLSFAVPSVAQQATTIQAPSGSEVIIIIATNAGGSASWQNMNAPMANTPPNPMTHQVTVGGSGLVYSPNSIMANVGDYVQFNFLSQNHTITQSSFATPCVNAMTFDSGFMPNMNNATNPPPAVKIQVKDTTPAWFYCRQKTPKSHCGAGMTFSINPTPDKTQAMFMQMAMQQNGTDAGAAPPAASAAAPASPSAVTAAPPAGTSIATGTGSVDGTGACQCSCLCGVAQFPMMGSQGMGNFGGMSGALPTSSP